MRTFDTREAADAAVLETADPVMVCGTFKDEKPVYFILPAEADDDVVSDAAFQVREGRLPTPYERWLREQVGKLRSLAS